MPCQLLQCLKQPKDKPTTPQLSKPRFPNYKEDTQIDAEIVKIDNEFHFEGSKIEVFFNKILGTQIEKREQGAWITMQHFGTNG